MRKTMRRISIALALAVTGGFLLSLPPTASAQRVRQRVIIVGPLYDPFFPHAYPYYPYPSYYVPRNYGEVKIETHRKDAKVYIDGGFAATTDKAKKFALKPGNHDIELRDSDGQTIFRETVAVTIGNTTKLHVA
jgi:hypothetical protein